MDTSELKSGFRFSNRTSDPEWWDVNDKKLIGGNVELPGMRYMDVGIERSNEGYLVYIRWYEI